MSAASAGHRRAKKERLRRLLRGHGRILVAFSGGKDSFFLLREAILALGEANALAYFVNTPFTGAATFERIAYFRRLFPFSLHEIRLNLLADARLRLNPRQRCYLCKRRMFSVLKKEAKRLGIATVADGSTRSDLREHRPGREALKNLAIASPLLDAGFASDEIAAELKKLGFAANFLTSSTCLATRFPYGFPLARKPIAAIGLVEQYLARRGIFPLRVRHIPDGIRVETSEANFKKMLAMKSDLLNICRNTGFRFITLDLGGIQSGPWDQRASRARQKAKVKR
jgi:uncharacterized protein